MKKITIAIDGLSATGKSTLARQLAARLQYIYIDSGAMYRAITLYFIQNHVVLSNPRQVLQALSEIQLDFVDQHITLNGMDIESEIRTMEVSNQVSEVSALESVRIFAVAQQKKLGIQKGIVMDGRDIGTTVFPDAELKIFLSASEEIRIKRRFEEMKIKDPKQSMAEISANLHHRDQIDTSRKISPLRKAEDAIFIDNSKLTMEEQLEVAYALALDKIKN